MNDDLEEQVKLFSDQKLHKSVKYHLDKLTRFRKAYRLDDVYTPLEIRIL